MLKKRFSASNIFTVIIIAGLTAIIFVPDAKAYMIRGLMSLGFFKPDVNNAAASGGVAVSNIMFSNAAGQTVSLNELKGKVVIINFWATWCPPCRAEMPSLNSLYEKLKADKKVLFIAVDADGDLAKSASFMQSNSYTLPLYKIDSNVEEQVYAGTLPTTVIIDKTGKMVLHHQGAADYDSKEMLGFLKALMSK